MPDAANRLNTSDERMSDVLTGKVPPETFEEAQAVALHLSQYLAQARHDLEIFARDNVRLSRQNAHLRMALAYDHVPLTAEAAQEAEAVLTAEDEEREGQVV